VPWSTRFAPPIKLPDGRKLVTLKDANAWLAKEVPKSERGMKQIQAAAHCVTEAAENDGPMMFARIGVMQAINRHPPQDQFHLAKAETPARRRLASTLSSCPRTLPVKSSWVFAPSTLLLLQDKRFGPQSVAC
jgi:hypothetical protein